MQAASLGKAWLRELGVSRWRGALSEEPPKISNYVSPPEQDGMLDSF